MTNRFDQDPTDEFEFKPLSEGLGFHKKIIDLRDDMSAGFRPSFGAGGRGPAAANQVTNQTTNHVPNQATTRAGNDAINQTPNPHQARRQAAQTTQATHVPRPSSVQMPLGWLPALQKVDMNAPSSPQISSESKKFSKISLSRTPVSLAAGVFDAAMVVGLALVFSAIVFALTKVELNDLLEMLQSEGGALIAIFVLLTAVSEIYAVICRTFFGKTLGEWAFECRLGTIEEQQTLLYPVKVSLRSFFVAITGFILLPVLSFLLKRDIAGAISGAYLYEEKK